MSIERSPTDRSGESPPSESPESSAFESLLRRVAGGLSDPELPQPEELVPGSVIGGRFELIREIGRGGFARVFEARDQVLSRPVAIKLLRRRRQLKDAELEIFYREARATARLNHPHIVTAHDWGAWNDMPFLVLELLDGESLERRLMRGPIGEHRDWEIIHDIADALAHAHGLGVLHLDLKTQNVFVLRDGWIKVLDFGLAGLDWAEDIPGTLERNIIRSIVGGVSSVSKLRPLGIGCGPQPDCFFEAVLCRGQSGQQFQRIHQPGKITGLALE